MVLPSSPCCASVQLSVLPALDDYCTAVGLNLAVTIVCWPSCCDGGSKAYLVVCHCAVDGNCRHEAVMVCRSGRQKTPAEALMQQGCKATS